MATIIFATCFSGEGETYRSVALPSIERVATTDDVILARPGDADGICAVYNTFLLTARMMSCDALVLIQDDVEIHDSAIREKILAALQVDGVGIVGGVGARHVTALDWWTGSGVGQVYETRGPIAFPERSGPVDAVDGLFLALSPRAISRLTFDEIGFPRFHGYDVDICFSARQQGLGVEVVPLTLLHRTKGGYKNSRDFDDAKKYFAARYCTVFPQVTPPPLPPLLARALGVRLFGVARSAVRAAFATRDTTLAFMTRAVASLRAKIGGLRNGSYRKLTSRPVVIADFQAVPTCLACGLQLQAPEIPETLPALLDCLSCHSSVTWPPPIQDITSDRIWRDQYRGSRLDKREQWLREAAIRLDWIESKSNNESRRGHCRILDVGAATGEFVAIARDRGYDVEGLEPSSWAVAVARDQGVELFEGSLSELPPERCRPADVVTLWHVLEHVPDPSELLGEIRKMLSTGGRVVVEVPNRQSSESQRLGKAWSGAQLEEHVTHFSPDGIRRLFRRNAFTIDSLETCSEQTYATEERWLRRTNAALLKGIEWPSLDLLRVIATPTAAVVAGTEG